jgi:glycoprotein endo-alpha-1,2-mannosidase
MRFRFIPKQAALILVSLSLLCIPAHARVAKQVLAFWYGWYGTPAASGHWEHWTDVNPQNHRIGNAKDYPVVGAYDTHDPQVIARNIDEAKEAGITGFIASWWGKGDFTDRGLPTLLSVAREKGMVISAMYEIIRAEGTEARIKAAVGDIGYILTTYGKDPAWLKVDGKPVVFIYGRAGRQLTIAGWAQVVEQLHQLPGGAVVLPDTVLPEAIRVFDGSFVYTLASHTEGQTVEAIRKWSIPFMRNIAALPGPGKVSTVTVMPGFNDSAVKPTPHPITERRNGDTYRILWEAAIKANPDYVIISSWNEWHEGSEIEPSVQYGTQYLQETARFSKQFLSEPPR